MISERRLRVGAISGALLLLLVYYFPWLSGQQSFYQSDITYYFQPLCQFIGDSLRHGQVPLWNPYLWCGMSQIAVASPAVFYPPTWLFALGSFSQALAAYLILHQLIALIGTYFVCKRLGVSSLGSVLAGFVAALNGYMFSAVNNFTLIATAAWFPLAVAGFLRIDRSFDRRNMIAVTVAAVAVALMIMAGRPEVFGVACLTLVAFAVIDCLLGWRARGASAAARQLGWRAAAMFLGVLLAMPLLAPVSEWWRVSYRAFGLSPGSILIWSANWYDWVCLFFVQPFGDLSLLDARLRALVNSRYGALPYLQTGYVGAIPATLALIALYVRTCRYRWWLLSFGVITALVASGYNTPVAPWLVTHIPFTDFFRYPIKLIIFPIFCIAVLSGVGFDAIARRGVSLLSIALAALVWIAALCLGATFRFAGDVYPIWYSIPVPSDFMPLSERLLDAQLLLGRSLVSGGLFGLGICFFIGMQLNKKVGDKWFGWLTLTAGIASLALAAFLYPAASAPGDFFKTPSVLADWVKPRLADASGINTHRLLPVFIDTAHHPPSTGGLDVSAYRYARAMLYENQPSSFKIPSESGYEGSPTGRFLGLNGTIEVITKRLHDPAEVRGAENESVIARLCKITATRYVSLPRELGDEEVRPMVPLDPKLFDKVFESEPNNVQVFEVKDVNPRAYFARSIKWLQDWTPFYDRLGSVSPWDSFDDVFVRGENGRQEFDVKPAARDSRQENIQFQQDEPNYVRLRVKTSEKRLLVLADTHFPGWKAFIDGAPANLYKANVFFRAVTVPPGEHLIEMRYQPESLSLGFALFALAAASLAALCLRAPGTARDTSDKSVTNGNS